jgi:hypothetical protein
MRNNEWLQNRLRSLWMKYFSDIRLINQIVISFGVKAKRRLGSIRKDSLGNSVITITGYFKNPEVPDYVIDETIIHELIHYTHGFSSDLKKLHKHPHRGGVIKKEMIERGAENIYEATRKWLDQNWIRIIEKR